MSKRFPPETVGNDFLLREVTPVSTKITNAEQQKRSKTQALEQKKALEEKLDEWYAETSQAETSQGETSQCETSRDSKNSEKDDDDAPLGTWLQLEDSQASQNSEPPPLPPAEIKTPVKKQKSKKQRNENSQLFIKALELTKQNKLSDKQRNIQGGSSFLGHFWCLLVILGDFGLFSDILGHFKLL